MASFKKGFLKLSGAALAAHLLSAATSPVLSRIYTPEDFGVAAIFTALLGFLSLVATLRLELAIPSASSDHEAVATRQLCMVLSVCGALTVTSIVLVAPHEGGGELLSGIWPYRWLFPPLIILACSYQALHYSGIRERKYGVIANCRVRQTLSGTFAALALGFTAIGPTGLILGAALSSTAGVYYLWRRKLDCPGVGLDELLDIWSKRRAFGIYATAASVLNASGTLLPPIIIPLIYGQEVTGSFALASRVIGMPMLLVGVVVAQISLSEGAALNQSDARLLPQLFGAITKRLIPVAALVLILGALCPFFFDEIMGDAWHEAGYFAGFLSLGAAAQVVVSPMSQIVFILNKTKVQLVLDAIRAPLVILALTVPILFGCDARVAVFAYSGTMFAHYIVSFFVYRRLLNDKA